MNQILIREFNNMLVLLKNNNISSKDELERIEKVMIIEKKKDLLKNMILFCRQYLKNSCKLEKKNYIYESYIYGGFVRDWCIPCLREDLDCMDIISIEKMFEKYPNFDIPCDLDFVENKLFDIRDVMDIFSSITETTEVVHELYGELFKKTKLSILTMSGESFNVDISKKLDCIEEEYLDFDVNEWRFHPIKGIFHNAKFGINEQRLLIRSLENIRLKKCKFVGVFKHESNTLISIKRQKYVERFKKMLLKGWDIINLNKSYLELLQPNIMFEDDCMICRESMVSTKVFRLNCCRATMHLECIFEWIEQCMKDKLFATCPGCRYEFSLVNN